MVYNLLRAVLFTLDVTQFWLDINIMKPLSNNDRGLMLGHVSRPHAIEQRQHCTERGIVIGILHDHLE